MGKAHPDFDDERLFQTARAANIVQLIKVVVEEYINHISPYWFKLLADPTPCYTAIWNRENWIPVEFNLLYRWHSLVPEIARWRGGDFPMADARFGNERMLRDGLGAALDAASTSNVWRIGLFNTAEMLRPVEAASLAQGRANGLASYNDYREVMQYPRVTRFEQISGDPEIVDALRDLYGDVDRVEFFVGLFAEDAPERSAVPPLIGRMVAADAFSHALTNPLLAPEIFCEETFTPTGWASINATSTLADIADRNLPKGTGEWRICMDHPEHHSIA
jgi:prostaglandin-endoperoxide synthase 2